MLFSQIEGGIMKHLQADNGIRRMVLVLIWLCLIPMNSQAADEDMNASVYLTFDPVTGTFTSTMASGASDQQTGSATGNANSGSGTPADNSSDKATNSITSTPAVAQSSSGDETVSDTRQNNPALWAGIALASLLVIGAVIITRRGSRTQAT